MALLMMLLVCLGGDLVHGQGSVAVNISATSTIIADFTPGPNEYRAASEVIVTCIATGLSETLTYQWTSTCRDCIFQNSTENPIKRGAVHSGDTGIHTCTVTSTSEQQNASASIVFNVVDAGIHVFVGSSTPKTAGSLPNNGLVIACSTCSIDDRGFSLRFFCRSDSMMQPVGEFIGLDGIAIRTDGPFLIDNNIQPGEIMVNNMPGSQDALTASEQGVYTCRIPLQSGMIRDINIGVYPSGFNTVPSINNTLVFTSGSPPTLTCTSTGSPPTTVTFTRDIDTPFILRDGEEVMANGVTYQLTQTLTNRQQSTYENVLSINQPLVAIMGSTFTCIVANTVGTSYPSQIVIRPDIEITSSPRPLTVGDTATYTCISPLGAADIEWLNVTDHDSNIVLEMDSEVTQLDLVLAQVAPSIHGRVYTCRVAIGGSNTSQDVTVTVQVPTPLVSVTHNGGTTLYVGTVLTLTCNITVTGTPMSDVMVTSTWTKAGGNVLRNTSRITVSPAMLDSGTTYISTVVINTLIIGNAGTYTCEAFVLGTLEMSINSSDTAAANITLAIQNPPLAVSAVTSTARLPAIPPYNTFILTCTATTPVGVVLPKTFMWRRNCGLEDSCDNLSPVIASGTLQIINNNLDQPVSTSMLTVNETAPAIWHYCCQASLTDIGVSSSLNGVLSITVSATAELDPVMDTGKSSEAVIGGAMGAAVALLLAYSVLTTVVIIIRRHPTKGSEAAKSGELAIGTIQCVAYGRVQQPPPTDDVEQDYVEI